MIDNIICQYSQKGKISPSRELYLPLGLYKEFIESCNRSSIAIIGVEIFSVIGEKIIPSNPIKGMDCSEKLNEKLEWNEIVKECNNEIRQVLKIYLKDDENQYFNPTMFEENEMK